MPECIHCTKYFEKQYTLNRHIKTSKQCLIIQGKIVTNYKCDGCDKLLSQQGHLKRHQKICIDYIKYDIEFNIANEYQNEILIIEEQYKNEILFLKKSLKEKDKIIEKLLSRPTVVNNNNNTTNNNNNIYNQFAPITTQLLDDNKNKITSDHVRRGTIGMTDYILKNPLKDNAVCTDFSRKKIIYRNENGEIVSDNVGGPLIPRILESVHPNIKNMMTAMYDSINNNPEYDDETKSYKIIELATNLSQINQSQTGLDTKYLTELRSKICASI